MPVMLGIGIGAPLIGGIAGNLASQGDRDRELALQQQALQGIQNVQTPDIQKMQLALQQYQNAGQISPLLEGTVNQQGSALGNIQTDPRLQQAQMDALSKMQQYGQGGLTAQDTSTLNQIKNSVAQQANARDQSILQNMQQRGIGGSGAELAARLGSSQNAANMASDQGMTVSGQAQQRALQSIMGGANLGAQMQAQSFNQQAQQGSAQDIINRYNAMNSQSVMGRNVGAQNQAQAQNLATRQSLMNANTGLGNQQQQYNAQLQQQNYNNQLQRAQVAAGQSGKLADAYGQRAQQTGQMFAGMGAGVGQAAGYGAIAKGLQGRAATPAATPNPFDPKNSNNADNYGENGESYA